MQQIPADISDFINDDDWGDSDDAACPPEQDNTTVPKAKTHPTADTPSAQKNAPAQKSKKRECASCGRQMVINARGLCGSCYRAEEEAGTLEQNYPRKTNKASAADKCASCGELKAIKARGMCAACYNRINYHKNKHKKKQSRVGTAHQTTQQQPQVGNAHPTQSQTINAATPEPAPQQNGAEPVYKHLVRAIEERAALGRTKYGTDLQPNNGRNCLNDALQESLDMNMYLMQRIVEQQQIIDAIATKIQEATK